MQWKKLLNYISQRKAPECYALTGAFVIYIDISSKGAGILANFFLNVVDLHSMYKAASVYYSMKIKTWK